MTAGEKSRGAATNRRSGAGSCGTHALYQDQVVSQKLGLAVIDEQHRSGWNSARR